MRAGYAPAAARCGCEQEQGAAAGEAGRAARRVSLYGMLRLVSPTALAVGSGVNSTRIVYTITLTCSVAVRSPSPASHPGKPRWADTCRAVPVLGGARA